MKNNSYSKMVAILALVLAIAVSLWFAPPATLCYAQEGYAVEHVGGGGGAPHPSFTWLRNKMNIRGELTQDVTAESPDELCQLTINKGTKALTKRGNLLPGIIMVDKKSPPAPPSNASAITLAYDLSPDGATFDPPITLTFTYDPDEIPEGISEENLVIAMWDEEAGEWVNLVSTVDPTTDTITARVSHFTTFTVIAYTSPAAFTTSALSISPTEVNIGKTVTITAVVANTGDLTGSYEVTLKIDNVVIATKGITLAGGASQKVTFTTSKDVAGTYTVTVNGLSGKFVVKTPPAPPPAPPAPPVAPPPAPAAFTTSDLTISPAEINIGESATISLLVTNTSDLSGSYEVALKIDNVVVATEEITLAGGASQKVTFATTKDVAGTYTVTVDGLSDTFTVKALINWYPIGGIIAAAIIIGIVIALVIRRQRA